MTACPRCGYLPASAQEPELEPRLGCAGCERVTRHRFEKRYLAVFKAKVYDSKDEPSPAIALRFPCVTCGSERRWGIEAAGESETAGAPTEVAAVVQGGTRA